MMKTKYFIKYRTERERERERERGGGGEMERVEREKATETKERGRSEERKKATRTGRNKDRYLIERERNYIEPNLVLAGGVTCRLKLKISNA